MAPQVGADAALSAVPLESDTDDGDEDEAEVEVSVHGIETTPEARPVSPVSASFEPPVPAIESAEAAASGDPAADEPESRDAPAEAPEPDRDPNRQ
jgi:hypothetical protein